MTAFSGVVIPVLLAEVEKVVVLWAEAVKERERERRTVPKYISNAGGSDSG